MTQMVAKQPENKTQMVAPKGKVKIEALETIRIAGEEIPAGKQVEVEAEVAQDFLKPYKLHYNFGGERSDDSATRHERVRAKLVR